MSRHDRFEKLGEFPELKRGFACREEHDVSKSLWETIQGRDTLEAFPCVADFFCIVAGDAICDSDDIEKCPDRERCGMLPIFREYLALRAVVEAELDGATPEAKAASNRRLADAADRTQQAAPGPYTIKAEAWEGIA